MLAGLNAIDQSMSDIVHGLESIIRQSTSDTLRTKALETTLALVAGGFHTSLVSYFMHKDLFSALMKVSTNSHSRGECAALTLDLSSTFTTSTQRPPPG